ncbi:MAG: flavodoxin family protein [Candidatus Atribacteria bacterium]|nr:flavodoxin family protein [Candidatus Atribacteria bacterium]
MKKITAFIGSARKKGTYLAVQEFEKNLKKYGDIDFEYVFLSDYNLEFCSGCKLCFDKGEQFCPYNDDRNVLIAKLEEADGVVFASPSYAFQVSGRMKNFIDRIAFIYHRPRFFKKIFTAIATQFIPFGNQTQKYLESVGHNLGFDVLKGTTIITPEPIPEKQLEKLKANIMKLAGQFNNRLYEEKSVKPSLFKVITFRMTRSGLQSSDLKLYDYEYYKEKGWFKSGYYYDIHLDPIQRVIGGFSDFLGRKLFK